MDLERMRGRFPAVYVAVVVLLTAWIAVFVVRNFRGPIVHMSDPGQYAFTSYYFSQNISWLPLPRLALATAWTVYPYGIDHVFLHWSFERDVLNMLAVRLAGNGPWFQIYFLVSLVATALGSFLILKRDCGPYRAAAAGLAVSFLNYYAVGRFPLHQPLSCLHWTTLGVFLDYVLVRRYSLGIPWSLRLIGARLVVLVLGLGLELGYLAGFGLTSFCLTVPYLMVLALIRHRASPHRLVAAIRAAWPPALANARKRRAQLAGLAAIGLVATWLYVPLAYQVREDTKLYDFSGLQSVTLSSNPLRLLIPFLPAYNPKTLHRIFDDRSEVWGFDFSPGLGFVLLGLSGLIAGRRRWVAVVPFLVFFVICLAFDPVKFPTLHVFPWFRFARVPGRATTVFPVLLATFYLGLPPLRRASRWTRWAVASITLLVAVETATAYDLIVMQRVHFPDVETDDAFRQTMQAIRETPGEAVFEWPFAIAPQSGRLGYYHRFLGGISQLAEFHHKKAMSAYFGRLQPVTLAPIEAAGWPPLIFPTAPYAPYSRQRRDFTVEEWRFVESFVRAGDFAGILLYPDLLQPATAEGFYARFGKPIAEFELPTGPGRIQFIPKDEAWRAQVDVEEALALRLERPVFVWKSGRRIEAKSMAIEDYLVGEWALPNGEFRWTWDSPVHLRFRMAHAVDSRFRMMARSWGKQRLRVTLNGAYLGERELANTAHPEEFELPAELLRDVNELTFELPDAPTFPGKRKWGLVGMGFTWMELVENEPELSRD